MIAHRRFGGRIGCGEVRLQGFMARSGVAVMMRCRFGGPGIRCVALRERVNGSAGRMMIGTAMQHASRGCTLYGYRQRQQRDNQETAQLDHGALILMGRRRRRPSGRRQPVKEPVAPPAAR